MSNQKKLFPSNFKIKKIKLDPITLNLSKAIIDLIEKYQINLSISVLDNDAVNKPTIIFGHGIGACKETFLKEGVLDALIESHRVIAFDIPGHGASYNITDLKNISNEERAKLAAEIYNMPSLINQYAQLLTILKTSDTNVFGWSVSGHIFHGVCIKYPYLVNKLITSGSPLINFTEPEKYKEGFSDWFVDIIIQSWINNPVRYQRLDSINEKGQKEFGAETIMASMGYTDLKEGGFDDYVVKALMKMDPLLTQYLYTTLNEHKHKPELRGKDFVSTNTCIPIMCIEGEEDRGCVFNKLRAFFMSNVQGKNPHSRLYSFPDTGHAVFRVHPREFVMKIKEFINQSPPEKQGGVILGKDQS